MSSMFNPQTPQRSFPIQELPTELLSQIFDSCIPTQLGNVFPNPSPHYAPLLLCRVCSRWRKLAILTPTLWSALPSLNFGYNPSYEDYFELYELYLQRSGGTLLSLSLVIISDSSQQYTPILENIIANAERYRHLSLTISPTMFRTLSRMQHRLTALETFKIRVIPPTANISSRYMATFAETPCLRDLTLYGTSTSQNNFISSPGTAARLTRFTGFFIGAKSAVDLLREAHNLEECRFIVKEPLLGLQLLPDSPVTSPHLRLLALRAKRYPSGLDVQTGFLRFLACLTAPALQELYLTNDGTVGYPRVMEWIQRCGCSLKKLVLAGLPRDTRSFSKVLKLVPGLEELEVDPLNSNDISALSIRPHGYFLVPKLRKLVGTLEDHLNPERLQRLVELRVEGSTPSDSITTHPLKVLYILFERELEAKIVGQSLADWSPGFDKGVSLAYELARGLKESSPLNSRDLDDVVQRVRQLGHVDARVLVASALPYRLNRILIPYQDTKQIMGIREVLDGWVWRSKEYLAVSRWVILPRESMLVYHVAGREEVTSMTPQMKRPETFSDLFPVPDY